MTLPSDVRQDFERRLGESYSKEEIPFIIGAASRPKMDDPVAFIDKMVADREITIRNTIRTDGRFKSLLRKGALNNPERRTEGLKRTAARRVASVAKFNQRRLIDARQRESQDAGTQFWRNYDATHGRFRRAS